MMDSFGDRAGLSVPIHAMATDEEERIQIAPGLGGVHVNDVLCGRGKISFNHAGNKRFREAITKSLDDYRRAVSRTDKSTIVQRIIDEIANSGGRFLKKNQQSGEWYQLSEQQTKEKVSHAVRDAANTMDAKKTQGKGKFKSVKSDRLSIGRAGSLPSFTSRGSPLLGSSNFYENLDRATREIRRHASQQQNPSWSRAEHSFDPFEQDQVGHLAGERLPIRPVRDFHLPGEHHHPMMGTAPHSHLAPMPGVHDRSGFDRGIHTNSLSEPNLGGLLPLGTRHSGTASIMMPEGPRIGFAQAPAPSTMINRGTIPTPPRLPEHAIQQRQGADEGDHFLDRINDVLGPLPSDEDDPVGSYLARQNRRHG